MYKLQNSISPLGEIGDPCAVIRSEDGATIPFDPANTDYANFKSQINADEAELQDAEGNVMTPEAAKAFVKELP